MKWMKDRFNHSLFLLIVIYAVGILTTLAGYADNLMKLTAYNLLFATALLIYNAKVTNKAYVIWFMLIGVSGYLIELVGILTGLIFGEYSYGDGLGVKLFDVPLMIGVNWSVLVFASAALVDKLKIRIWMKAAMAATMMVLYDFLLEPVAVRFDFWTWSGNDIPVQNYIAWWIIAFFMLLGVITRVKPLENKIAGYVIGIQTLFFAILIVKEGLNVF
ncbi:MAG: carotenoid biosynthesis protein [Bacteroidales bacterium]|nr:carotenoid biosynthesis protein [Bacteroidales bacterium]